MLTSHPSPSIPQWRLQSAALVFLVGLTVACTEPPTESPARPAPEAVTTAEEPGPKLMDPELSVRTAATGLTNPIGMAFLGAGDMLVLERTTGKVQRVVNGTIQSTPVLDLAVNFAQERGLVGIALHPAFPATPWVYLFWTESSTGADVSVPLSTPLLGNRVDRFVWDGASSTLTYDKNIIQLRAVQNDGAVSGRREPMRANHNGGVLRFGPDGKLYILVGDLQRRSQLQNLPSGPTPTGLGPTVDDDQFGSGGPEPDDAHFAGGILRLNDDGSTPVDNPFFSAGAQIGGEVGRNIQKLFAYGLRNSIGMAFDPLSGTLWDEENGDDAFDELNRVEPGMNSGWIQIMGPLDRIAQRREIELTSTGGDPEPGIPPAEPGLFRAAWPPANIAQTPEEALSRMFVLPGSHYSDPEFSWKYGVPPAGIGFLNSRALGPQYEGDLFVGSALPIALAKNGFLFHFNLTGNREQIAVDDPRLEDRVADNTARLDFTESETLLFGTDFGVVTDIHTGPNGNLFVVSITGSPARPGGAIYEIYRSAGGEDEDTP